MENNENVKITVILKNKGNLLANVNISIETVEYGYLTIKGFQIWRSIRFNERLQESINIKPPCRPYFGRYINLTHFEVMEKWYLIEGRIYEEYVKRKTKQDYGNENVDPDSIPI